MPAHDIYLFHNRVMLFKGITELDITMNAKLLNNSVSVLINHKLIFPC